jgi:hypothetical protein
MKREFYKLAFEAWRRRKDTILRNRKNTLINLYTHIERHGNTLIA